MEKRINFLEKPENIRLRGKTPDYWCKIDKDNNYGDHTLEWWSRDYAPVLGKAEYGSGEKSFKDVAIGLEALGFHMRITTLQDTRYEDSDGIGDWDVMDGIGVEVTKKAEGQEDIVKLLYFVRSSEGAYFEGGGNVQRYTPKVLTDLQVFSDEILFAFNIGNGGKDPSGSHLADEIDEYWRFWEQLPREVKELGMDEGGYLPPTMYGEKYD
tara:strand:+ start:742 stop:1374 length:633 start_codon:yes stop_codon:yes gene_type:complete